MYEKVVLKRNDVPLRRKEKSLDGTGKGPSSVKVKKSCMRKLKHILNQYQGNVFVVHCYGLFQGNGGINESSVC